MFSTTVQAHGNIPAASRNGCKHAPSFVLTKLVRLQQQDVLAEILSKAFFKIVLS